MTPPKTPKLAGKSVARQPAPVLHRRQLKPLQSLVGLRNAIIADGGADGFVIVMVLGEVVIVPSKMPVAGMDIGEMIAITVPVILVGVGQIAQRRLEQPAPIMGFGKCTLVR